MGSQDYKLKMSPVLWGLINVDTCKLLYTYFRQLSCNCGNFYSRISHQSVATEELATISQVSLLTESQQWGRTHNQTPS